MPIPGGLYNPGYSLAQPFGAGGYANIDPITGLTSYYIPNQGFFVVSIEIREYRNGQPIATIRRDLQLIAIVCPPNNPPVLSSANGSGRNDSFYPVGHAMPDYTMSVYNRWGQLVYIGDNEPWLGLLDADGSLAPEGVYVYLISYDGKQGKKVYNGRITLLR